MKAPCHLPSSRRQMTLRADVHTPRYGHRCVPESYALHGIQRSAAFLLSHRPRETDDIEGSNPPSG